MPGTLIFGGGHLVHLARVERRRSPPLGVQLPDWLTSRIPAEPGLSPSAGEASLGSLFYLNCRADV